LDRVRNRLDPSVLAPIRTAEFSLLLRSRQYVHLRSSLARKPADIFLAGNQSVVVSDSIHHRPRRRARNWTPLDRRIGIHVRSTHRAGDSSPQPVSRGDAAVIAVGDSPFRLRPPRMEISNADRVDRGSHQLLLASGIRRELGPRPLLSRAARRSRTYLSAGIPAGRAHHRLFSNPPDAGAMGAPMEVKQLIFLTYICLVPLCRTHPYLRRLTS